MENESYESFGISIFTNDPEKENIEEVIEGDSKIVKTYGDQIIDGNKTFNGTVTIENEIIHNSTSFSTEDGIIEQLKGNNGDLLDYGNYAVYNDGVGTKYKGIINKKNLNQLMRKLYLHNLETLHIYHQIYSILENADYGCCFFEMIKARIESDIDEYKYNFAQLTRGVEIIISKFL